MKSLTRKVVGPVSVLHILLLLIVILVVINVPHSQSYAKDTLQRSYDKLAVYTSRVKSPHSSHTSTTDEHVKPFPKKIWQTWRAPLAALDEEDIQIVRSWQKLNPDYRYELLTDQAAETYILDHFQDTRSDIIETYFGIHDPILRSDFLRYLILLSEGGVYTDLDTRALKPIKDWIPPWWVDDVNIVIGVEIDQPDDKWADWYYDYAFCQWTIMSKPGHPIIETAVRRVITSLWKFAESQNTSLAGIKPSYMDVLGLTGPGAFTDSVFENLSQQTGRNITKYDITGQKTPKLYGDILLLPVNAFATGQVHSGSGRPVEEDAFVEHLFKGSWKNEDHVYGTGESSDGDEEQSELEIMETPESEEETRRLEEERLRREEEFRRETEEQLRAIEMIEKEQNRTDLAVGDVSE